MTPPPPPVDVPEPPPPPLKLNYPIEGYTVPDAHSESFFDGIDTPDDARKLILRTKLEIDIIQSDYMIHNNIKFEDLEAKYDSPDFLRYAPNGPLRPSAALACRPIMGAKARPVVFFQTLMHTWGKLAAAGILGDDEGVLSTLNGSWPFNQILKELVDTNVALPFYIVGKYWSSYVGYVLETVEKIEDPDAPTITPAGIRLLTAGTFSGDEKNSRMNLSVAYNQMSVKLSELENNDLSKAEFSNMVKYASFTASVPELFYNLPVWVAVDDDIMKIAERDLNVNVAAALPPNPVVPYPSVFVQARCKMGRMKTHLKRLMAADAGSSRMKHITAAEAAADKEMQDLKDKIIQDLSAAFQREAANTTQKIREHFAQYLKDALSHTFSTYSNPDGMLATLKSPPTWSKLNTVTFVPLVFDTGDTYGVTKDELLLILHGKGIPQPSDDEMRAMGVATRPSTTVHPDADVLDVSTGDAAAALVQQILEEKNLEKAKADAEKAISDEEARKLEIFKAQEDAEKARRERIETKLSEVHKFSEEISKAGSGAKVWYDPSYGCAERLETSSTPRPWYENMDRDTCLLWIYMSKDDNILMKDLHTVFVDTGATLASLQADPDPPGALRKLQIKKILEDFRTTLPEVAEPARRVRELTKTVPQEYKDKMTALLGGTPGRLKQVDMLRDSPLDIWNGIKSLKFTCDNPERFADTSSPDGFMRNALETADSALATKAVALEQAAIDEVFKKDAAIPDTDPREIFKFLALEWFTKQATISAMNKATDEIIQKAWEPELTKFLGTKDELLARLPPEEAAKGITPDQEEIYRNKFAVFMLGHKTLRQATKFDIDEGKARLWHPSDVANALMEMNSVLPADDAKLEKPAAAALTVGGKQFIHTKLPQFVMASQEVIAEQDRRKLRSMQTLGDVMAQVNADTSAAAITAVVPTGMGADTQVSANTLMALQQIASGGSLTQAQQGALQAAGGRVDPALVVQQIASDESLKQVGRKIFTIFTGRDPTPEELAAMGGGGSGVISSGGGGGGGMGGGMFFPLAFPGPSMTRPRTRKGTRGARKEIDYGVQELKSTVRKMASFVRDYPKIQSKAWSAKKVRDADLASSVFKRATDLLAVVATETPPLGQVVDADGRNVIGFMNQSGVIVPAPMMSTVPGIPVVVSNNRLKYNALLKDAVAFSNQYSAAMARFKKSKR